MVSTVHFEDFIIYKFIANLLEFQLKSFCSHTSTDTLCSADIYKHTITFYYK